MAEIKAIETKYNGYKFRSRLEARWAVFFDALNIKYEYEKEGYDLGEQGWYLPDFWLPEFEMWVEIKSNLKWGSEEYKTADRKAKALRSMTNKPVILVRGDPAETTWYAFYGFAYIECGDGECCGCAVFAKGDDKPFLMVFNIEGNFSEYEDVLSLGTGGYDKINLQRIKTRWEAREQFASVIDEWISNNVMCVFDRKENNSEIDKAALKARQARFEHGEKG